MVISLILLRLALDLEHLLRSTGLGRFLVRSVDEPAEHVLLLALLLQRRLFVGLVREVELLLFFAGSSQLENVQLELLAQS